MFYRYVGDRRLAVDLEGVYSGSCFLVGGAPQIECENQWQLLEKAGVVSMAMNNVALKFKPTFWIGADKPSNYSKSILYDPSFLHFAYLSRCSELIDDKKWWNFPATFFMAGREKEIKNDTFFKPVKYFVWWKNVFMVAIHVLYYLGFRTVYTVGCKFEIYNGSQYSYGNNLTKEQVDYNRKTYRMVLGQLNGIVPYFKEAGFSLINCTMNSVLSGISFMNFEDAIKEELNKIPKANLEEVEHPLKQGKENDSTSST